MALMGDWAKAERYARLGQLGGYQNKSGKPFEYRRGMPKLTQAQQAALLLAYSLKAESVSELALRFGVSPSYVSKLASRKGVEMRECAERRAIKHQAAMRRLTKPKEDSLVERMRKLRAKLGITP